MKQQYVWVVDENPSSIEAALLQNNPENLKVVRLISQAQLDVAFRTARVFVLNPAQSGRVAINEEPINPFFVVAKYHEYAQEKIDENTAPFAGWKPATLIGCDPYDNISTKYHAHVFSSLQTLQAMPDVVRKELMDHTAIEAHALERRMEFGVENPVEHLSPFWWQDVVAAKTPETLPEIPLARKMTALEIRLKMMEEARKKEKKPLLDNVPPMAAIVGGMTDEARQLFEKLCAQREARGWAT